MTDKPDFTSSASAINIPETTTTSFFGYGYEYDGLQVSIREIYDEVKQAKEDIELAHAHIDDVDVPFIKDALDSVTGSVESASNILEEVKQSVTDVSTNADKAMESAVTASVGAQTATQEADRAVTAANSVVDITDKMKAEVDKANAAATSAQTSADKAEQAAETAATDAANKAATATKDALIDAVSDLTDKASKSASDAISAKDNAIASATAAKASEDASEASETNAKVSETNAKASEDNAAQSATDAKKAYEDIVPLEASAKSSATTATAAAFTTLLSANSAKTSATNAAFSEDKAARSAKTAADAAIEAMYNANQTFVSGGVFKITAEQEYPNVAEVDKDTLWIIQIDPVSEAGATYTFKTGSLVGKTIGQGWHLVYDTPDNNWHIIPMGATSVVSVNGYHGEVVLDADDVGAIPDTELQPLKDSITTNTTKIDTLTTEVNTKIDGLTAGDVGAVPMSMVHTASGLVNLDGMKNKIPKISSDGVMEVGKYLDFHDAGSAADYSVRLTCNGTTIETNGAISAGSSYYAKMGSYVMLGPPSNMTGGWARGLECRPSTNSALTGGVGFYGGGTSHQNVYMGCGSTPWSTGFTMDTANVPRVGSYRIYHEGFKPSASSINALPAIGGMVAFPLWFNKDSNATSTIPLIRSKQWEYSSPMTIVLDNYSVAAGGIRVGKDSYWIYTGSYEYQPKVCRGSKYYTIYHQGFKPSLRDIESEPNARGVKENLMDIIDELRTEISDLKAEVSKLKKT